MNRQPRKSKTLTMPSDGYFVNRQLDYGTELFVDDLLIDTAHQTPACGKTLTTPVISRI